MDKIYNFGEKPKEKVKTESGWADLEVWQSPKYTQSKEEAIKLIKQEKIGLDESDFWILMNKGGNKMVYSGLIISHNGCLKINDKLPKAEQFNPEFVAMYKDTESEKVMLYNSPEQGIYEFGETSSKNLKNDYPYAMVLKRLFDRVVLKLSKIAFNGIYSETEADDFTKRYDDTPTASKEVSKPTTAPNLTTSTIPITDKAKEAEVFAKFQKLKNGGTDNWTNALKYFENTKYSGQVETMYQKAMLTN
jgi:hypothetical protein